MSSVPDQDEDPGSGAPVPWWNATSQVGGDVVLSGAVLLFMALAFAFVLYHYFTVSRRRGERDDVVGAGAVSSGVHRRRRRGTVRLSGESEAAAAGGRGGVSPVALRALPLTVYSAKGRRASEEEELECAVCLAELVDGEAARFLPRCGHGFHAECVDLWLRGHSTCPLCRVEVDATDVLPLAQSLPPALPEPANYPRNLPTNVLFWGSQGAVTTTTARTASAFGGATASSSDGTPTALVIDVRDRETAAPPRGGGEAKPLGLARLSSLRRLWNRGRHDQDTADTSSRSCRRASAGGDGAEQALPSPLDIWNVT